MHKSRAWSGSQVTAVSDTVSNIDPCWEPRLPTLWPRWQSREPCEPAPVGVATVVSLCVRMVSTLTLDMRSFD